MMGQPFKHYGVAEIFHLNTEYGVLGYGLTNGGPVTFGPGKFGNCAIFGNPNSTKYLHATRDFGMDLTGHAGISIWFYLQALPGAYATYGIAFFGTSIGGGYVRLVYANISGAYTLRAASGNNVIDKEITLELNRWYLLDFDQDTENFYLYLDGVKLGSNTKGTTPAASNIALGSLSGSNFFPGNLDEAVFYNYHRAERDIRKNYAWATGKL